MDRDYGSRAWVVAYMCKQGEEMGMGRGKEEMGGGGVVQGGGRWEAMEWRAIEARRDPGIVEGRRPGMFGWVLEKEGESGREESKEGSGVKA